MANYKSLGHKISIIHRYTEIYLTEALKDFNLHGSGQTRIVMTLANLEEGISQDELARILLVDKATISRMIRPMINNGVIERKTNPSDKRAYIINLTEKTRMDVPRIRKITRKWTKILGQDLSSDELEGLFDTLDTLMNNAGAYIKGDDF